MERGENIRTRLDPTRGKCSKVTKISVANLEDGGVYQGLRATFFIYIYILKHFKDGAY